MRFNTASAPMDSSEMQVMKMRCPCCTSGLVGLKLQSYLWKFWKCTTCGYWTSRTLDDEWPVMEYNDAPTFDYDPSLDWATVVGEATRIMREKFRLAGRTCGRFLDVGCSEGVYVAASSQLGWQPAGVEIDRPK